MIRIDLSEEILSACPDLHILTVACDVANSESDRKLWNEISATEEAIRRNVKMEEVNKWLPIKATRDIYKKLGKDPNRYRPSSESLRRRVVKGLSLYKIDTLVDLINLVSLQSGYSIGGFDSAKIQGERLRLGVGMEGELYHGIGRGELNIAGLPVYRDALGGIGTPTSDEERTKISKETRSLFMIINGYSGEEGLIEAGKYAYDLLKRYAAAKNVVAMIISNDRYENVYL